MDEVYQKFQGFFARYSAPSPTEGPWLVAVSGGLDSMSLLFLTMRYAVSRGYQLVVAHVNHGLRTDSGLDEQMVREVCQEYSILFRTRRVDLNEIPLPEQKGVEADARKLRYRALFEIAREVGASAILLGHHAGDQVETMLWRLMRGTSLQGLGGIRPMRVERGVHLIRPLLELDKPALQRFAAKAHVPFREDTTNQNLDYTRNFIRHELIPKMQEVQPHLVSTLLRASLQIQDDESYLEAQSGQVLTKCAQSVGNRYKIDLTCFLSVPRPLQRRVIKIILYCLASEDWSFVHVESILDLCASPRPSARVSLPTGLAVWREYQQLWLGPAACLTLDEESHSTEAEVHWVFEDGVQLIWPSGQNLPNKTGWHFSCHVWTDTQGPKRNSAFELVLPHVSGAVIRRVQTSERMAQLGLQGTKKVQDIFVDAKVPKLQRSTWPGFYVDGQLVWLPGLRRSKDFLVRPEHQRGWLIRAQETG